MPQLDADEFLRRQARRRKRFELHHGFIVAFAGATLAHDDIACDTFGRRRN